MVLPPGPGTQRIEQRLQPVVIDLMHKRQQPPDFAIRKALAGKPGQIMTGHIGKQAPLVLAERHAARHQFVEVFGIHYACLSGDEADWSRLRLEAHIDTDLNDARADNYYGEFLGGNGWSMHIVDVSLALGDLVGLARTESAAWLAAHPDGGAIPPQ